MIYVVTVWVSLVITSATVVIAARTVKLLHKDLELVFQATLFLPSGPFRSFVDIPYKRHVYLETKHSLCCRRPILHQRFSDEAQSLPLLAER